MEIMREQKEANWFSRWEDELPSPEELMPLSQTLITPDLAIAFDIPTINSPAAAAATNNKSGSSHHEDDAVPIPPSSTLKKPRLVWTPQLHKRFVEAVAHLGIKNAVPKTIMQLMNVDGLTRENVASHLQKYRLYLKRMQHSSAAGGGGAASSSSAAAAAFAVDTATDRLFATAPVPSQLLRPFVPVAAMQHYRQMTAAAVHQNQYYNHGRTGGMMAVPPPQMGVQRMAVWRPPPLPAVPPQYAEGPGSGERNGRRVLTLFPTGED